MFIAVTIAMAILDNHIDLGKPKKTSPALFLTEKSWNIMDKAKESGQIDATRI